MMFPVMTSGILNSVLFGVYGNELQRLNSLCANNAERERKWRQHVFIAGSEAGFIYSFLACPIELIKIRLQTQNCTYPMPWSSFRTNHVALRSSLFSIWAHVIDYTDYQKNANKPRGAVPCIKRIYHNEGIFGFYRGLAPMICR